MRSIAGGETIARHDATLSGRIEEARLDGEDVRLVFGSGQSVQSSDVIRLRSSQD